MSGSEDVGRISVSRDALRAELLQLELRLVNTLATKGEVERVSEKVAAHDERITRLERGAADDDAVKRSSDEVFSKRMTFGGVAIAALLFILTFLADTGVLR